MFNSLLLVDKNLIAVCISPFCVFDITKQLPNQIIKSIVFDYHRFAILTTTNLYYLHVSDKFELVDLTDDVTPFVSIDEIKFISNSRNDHHNIGIFTTYNEAVSCDIRDNTFRTVKQMVQTPGKDIVAVPNKGMGYIYKKDEKYIVEQFNIYHNTIEVCTFDELPTQFISPREFLFGNTLMKYTMESNDNILQNYHKKVSHIYNHRYHSTDDDICGTVWNTTKVHTYGKHTTDNYKVLNIKYDYPLTSLIVITNDDSNVELVWKSVYGDSKEHIMKSHFCAVNLQQYTNNAIGVEWQPKYHHLFDEFTNTLVLLTLKCQKYGKFQKMLPRGLFYYLLQFVL